MDSLVLQILTGQSNSKAKLINEDDLKSDRPSNFTATIKDIDKVYALFPGQVLYVGYYEKMGTLTVQVADGEIIRYLNLTDIQLGLGETMNEGRYLGLADKQHGLQIEYCTQWQGESKMPVRVNTSTFFKQNPIAVLEGEYTPTYNKKPIQGYVQPDEIVELSKEQKNEFNNEALFAVPEITKGVYQVYDIQDIPPQGIDELTDGRGDI